ncbi:hypothetical protein [Leptolyngbya sp. 'hensonii']|uniref:hypothetical protein n=1 Tax=Leptolyngbya sp. 'hensonii' TaxID=1922337 RepID=UPI000B0A3777|nr:hypothetical protein [Leptolyngbya sp. 'hensonii']
MALYHPLWLAPPGSQAEPGNQTPGNQTCVQPGNQTVVFMKIPAIPDRDWEF